MLEDAELTVARQLHQRVALQNAALLRGEVRKKIAVEEEVAAVDPTVAELGLLAELGALGAVHLQLAETRRRVDGQDGAVPLLIEVELVLVGEVRVG